MCKLNEPAVGSFWRNTRTHALCFIQTLATADWDHTVKVVVFRDIDYETPSAAAGWVKPLEKFMDGTYIEVPTDELPLSAMSQCAVHVDAWSAVQQLRKVTKELRRLDKLVNTPELQDFAKGVVLEAAHQRERWSVKHDEGKTPFDWVFLVGHLATRAATMLQAGDTEKALHHFVTTAAALANWHAQVKGRCDVRPGTETQEA